jgi:hypothetical protein
MYRKLTNIITIVPCLLVVISIFMVFPTISAAADDTVTIAAQDVSIDTDEQGNVEHSYIITSEDGLLNITIPEGTTALDISGNPITFITAVPVTDPSPPPPGASIIGPVFNLGPSGATFSPSIQITFTYNDSNIPPDLTVTDLKLACYDETAAEWVAWESVVDTANKTVTAQVSHFTEYAVISGLPTPSAVFNVSNLVINPSPVEFSETVNISVDVTNNGYASGDYTLILKINGTASDSAVGTLAVGESKTVTFKLTGQSTGNYNVDIKGLTASYKVLEPPPPITETTTPPPTTKIITQIPTDTGPTSTTIVLDGPNEDEEPLSWWLITIIVVGGLLIVLVTWRLVRRAG